jgi:O-antigen/teichoic acid export membrane protein
MLGALYRSPAVRSAVGFGIGGVAFALANLIFARTIPPRDYGLLSLMIGVVGVAGPIAPLGLDYLLVRRGWSLHGRLRRLTLVSSLVVGLLTLVLSATLYRPGLAVALAIFAATVGAALSQLVAAHFQSRGQFGISGVFIQGMNWALLAIALLTWPLGLTAAAPTAALIAASGLVIAAAGWIMVARERPPASVPSMDGLWHEAFALMVINVTAATLLQLERLVLPMAAGIEELALFGVAAALVGSPFRMLQMAATFTIVPRMRDAATVADRRRLLRHEFALFCVIMAPAAVALWFLAPPLAHWFLHGRYDLGRALVLAMIVSGLLKVLAAFAASVVSALAPGSGLRLLGMLSWGCIVLACVAAAALRHWGLVGVIYAICLGWVARIAVAAWIAAPYLKQAHAAAPPGAAPRTGSR